MQASGSEPSRITMLRTMAMTTPGTAMSAMSAPEPFFCSLISVDSLRRREPLDEPRGVAVLAHEHERPGPCVGGDFDVREVHAVVLHNDAGAGDLRGGDVAVAAVVVVLGRFGSEQRRELGNPRVRIDRGARVGGHGGLGGGDHRGARRLVPDGGGFWPGRLPGLVVDDARGRRGELVEVRDEHGGRRCRGGDRGLCRFVRRARRQPEHREKGETGAESVCARHGEYCPSLCPRFVMGLLRRDPTSERRA
ncbi:hypothetical protein ACFPRL_35565 [Pseudoclavibacter helvolus]